MRAIVRVGQKVGATIKINIIFFAMSISFFMILESASNYTIGKCKKNFYLHIGVNRFQFSCQYFRVKLSES
jgi:hypothetical protein